MNSRIIVSLALASMSLLFATGCSSSAKKKSVEKQTTEVKAPIVPGTHYTTIVFKPGKSNLDSVSKEHLKQLTTKAHHQNKRVDEIRILAWSDKEYPDEVQEKASTKDIILASQRAQKIKDFLEEDLKETDDIDAYNMAKRPNLISKLFKNDEYEVKEAFEETGATGSKLPDGSVSYTKASKALVIVDYEGSEDKSK